jgi:sugar O-acyltransferase (sialic acid O-acetyltransferase NeuD family)
MSRSGKQAVIWGGTGQAKVLAAIFKQQGLRVAAILDVDPEVLPFTVDCPWFSDERDLFTWLNTQDFSNLLAAIAIGGTNGVTRCLLAQKLQHIGLELPTLIHERAWVADTVILGAGNQILGAACISEDARLGNHCIVNTNASIDHECVLGDGVHIMPGATIAGCVTVEDFASIGSNATILPRLRIGRNAVVGAGAVVTRDVLPGAIIKGNPAR